MMFDFLGAPLTRGVAVQPDRVPVSGNEPKEPALTVPLIASPSTVASTSSVIRIGRLTSMVKLMELPVTVPVSMTLSPIAPE